MKRDVAFPSEGETLRGFLHVPDDRPARGTLLLAHGLASDSREFADAPERLAERGWASLAFDRRGHGRSTGERGRIARAWNVADNQAALRFLVTVPEARAPYGLVAHSLGAAFGTATLAETPDLKAAALVAPMNRTLDEVGFAELKAYQAVGALSRLKMRLGLGALVVPYKVTYAHLFEDKAAMQRARETGFLHRTISLLNYDELMALDASAWAKRVTQPTLVVIAERDRAVQPGSSRRVFENLAGPKRLEVLLGSGHSAFSDAKSKELIDLIDAWMTRHLR